MSSSMVPIDTEKSCTACETRLFGKICRITAQREIHLGILKPYHKALQPTLSGDKTRLVLVQSEHAVILSSCHSSHLQKTPAV